MAKGAAETKLWLWVLDFKSWRGEAEFSDEARFPRATIFYNVLEQILEDINFDNLKDHEKNVSVVFDEMKIQGNLVYKKSTGKIIWYTEMGDLNEFSSLICSPEANALNI